METKGVLLLLITTLLAIIKIQPNIKKRLITREKHYIYFMKSEIKEELPAHCTTLALFPSRNFITIQLLYTVQKA